MKICILSMQKVPNFGSLLQSYSLKKMLEELGTEVHFIDIERNDEDDSKVKFERKIFKNEVEDNLGILSKLKKIDKYFFNRINIRCIANKQDVLFENFRKNNLNIQDEANNKEYDLCVIGSDEVFNCMAPSSWGFTSQLFGNVRQAENVVTYAASCGSTTYSQLNTEMCDTICNSFKKVSGFSARDKNTREFIEKLTDREVEEHLDPVWVGDFTEEINQTKISVKLPEKYCIIYSYYNRIHTSDEIEAILDFCKEKKLEPVAVGAPQMWLKNYVAVSPFEMLKIFEKANFIITDTFHGTIFSEKFNGYYAVLFRDSNKNKLSDLVKRINAEEHVISNFTELNKVYEICGDRSKSLELQKECREKSMEYLRKHIEG